MMWFVFLLSWVGLSATFSVCLAEAKACKCSYNQACWPSAREFASLSAKLSQPLLHPTPPASPCYSVPPETEACSDVIANTRNGIWRSNTPGALQNLNFETYIFPNDTISACYLNTTLGHPCGQGSIPPVGVDARSPTDVSAAVRFAKRHNLKLVVKNTGHDYLGRSAGRGGFMIWIHHMKGIQFHDVFVPDGAPPTEGYEEAVTLGAGVQWIEAHNAAAARDRFVVGGQGSVGAAGGWVLGGGHSVISGKYGLGVDNVLQFELVSADGSQVIVNEYTNPSLFWAVRGGGGGTFGVVTSVTYRTHPIVPLTLAFGYANFTSSDDAQRAATQFIHTHVALADNEWGGYSILNNSMLLFTYLAPNISIQDANATIGPLFSLLHEVGAEGVLTQLIPLPSIYSFISLNMSSAPSNQIGISAEVSSRLLSRETALCKAEETAKTLLTLDFAAISFVGGGAVSRPHPSSAGLNPSWRKALAEVYVAEVWENGAPVATIHAAQRRLIESTAILDRITEDSAAYLNEASLHETDFIKSFWGAHYPRLKRIKFEADPTSLFLVPFGVGSEDWDADLNCPL